MFELGGSIFLTRFAGQGTGFCDHGLGTFGWVGFADVDFGTGGILRTLKQGKEFGGQRYIFVGVVFSVDENSGVSPIVTAGELDAWRDGCAASSDLNL